MQFFVQFFIVQSVFSELNQQNGITLEIAEFALVDWVTPVFRRKSQVEGDEAKLKGGGGQGEGLKGNIILDKYGNEKISPLLLSFIHSALAFVHHSLYKRLTLFIL